jgi:hypothetical protein
MTTRQTNQERIRIAGERRVVGALVTNVLIKNMGSSYGGNNSCMKTITFEEASRILFPAGVPRLSPFSSKMNFIFKMADAILTVHAAKAHR